MKFTFVSFSLPRPKAKVAKATMPDWRAWVYDSDVFVVECSAFLHRKMKKQQEPRPP